MQNTVLVQKCTECGMCVLEILTPAQKIKQILLIRRDDAGIAYEPSLFLLSKVGINCHMRTHSKQT